MGSPETFGGVSTKQAGHSRKLSCSPTSSAQ